VFIEATSSTCSLRNHIMNCSPRTSSSLAGGPEERLDLRGDLLLLSSGRARWARAGVEKSVRTSSTPVIPTFEVAIEEVLRTNIIAWLRSSTLCR
jgi:hypothetical protein